MVSMTFFEGRLDIYVTETRDKRARRRDRDESKDESGAAVETVATESSSEESAEA